RVGLRLHLRQRPGAARFPRWGGPARAPPPGPPGPDRTLRPPLLRPRIGNGRRLLPRRRPPPHAGRVEAPGGRRSKRLRTTAPTPAAESRTAAPPTSAAAPCKPPPSAPASTPGKPLPRGRTPP